MHPDASRLLAAEASLRSEADAMLAASGIGAILAGAGYTAVGSYAMRTMTRRDLDFEHAEEPDWARHWEVGTQLAGTRWCVRLRCTDVYKEAWQGYGLYWEVRVVDPVREGPAKPDDPSVWNLDLWTARAHEFAPTRALRAAWMSAMTEEARSCILALKEILCREPKYGRSLTAMHIYEAVLGRGNTDLSELRCPPEKCYPGA
ncbi:MAG: hypothetical protein ABSD48_02920 [Armatimonadota bacterium]|jgi:hypothetical protein